MRKEEGGLGLGLDVSDIGGADRSISFDFTTRRMEWRERQGRDTMMHL